MRRWRRQSGRLPAGLRLQRLVGLRSLWQWVDASADTNPNACSDTNTDTNAYSNTNPDASADTDADAYTDANSKWPG